MEYWRQYSTSVISQLLAQNQYRNTPKYSDTGKIAVIILKFEQGGFAVE